MILHHFASLTGTLAIRYYICIYIYNKTFPSVIDIKYSFYCIRASWQPSIPIFSKCSQPIEIVKHWSPLVRIISHDMDDQ